MSIIKCDLPNDTILWRYMDVSKFLSLLATQSLHLDRVDAFKDKKEGMFPYAMKKELDEIYKNLEDSEILTNPKIQDADDFENYLKNTTYILCWHENTQENMVMWELYGGSKNSIAIKTTVGDLLKATETNDLLTIFTDRVLDKVKYQEYLEVQAEKSYRQPFFIKRPHYDFENEVRLYMRVNSHTIIDEENIRGYNLPLLNLKTLINGIYVHPDCDAWFFDAVRDLIQKYDLDVSLQIGKYGNKV